MKRVIVFLMALFCISHTQALTATAAEPFTPDEVVPKGLEGVPQNISAALKGISGLVASGSLAIPELSILESGFQEYQASRESCIQDQVRAATFCREETSPDLQKTLAGLNIILAGVNSLAINDTCKTFSKAMSLAQLGITAYTGACGLLRKKCNMSCAAAANGLKKILKGLVSNGATCTSPIPATCPAAYASLNTYKKQIYSQVKLEASMADKRTIHSKEKLCQHTYGLLLASSGVAILSLANSLKQGQQCDEESDAKTSGGNSNSTAPIAPTTPTPTTVSSPPKVPLPPPSSLPQDSQLEVAHASTKPEESIEQRKELIASPAVNSELRDYLPGGKKAVVSGRSETTYPEITGPGGKSNFEKMRIRFRELRLDAD
nr:hypothetical protein [uncultured Bdellovibrio sp.]